jgi:NADH dehydrogenase
MRDLTIAISGPTGFVGTNLRNYLNKKKIQMVCISRTKYKPLKSETMIVSSDFEKKNLAHKLKKCNGLVHLIGTGAQTIQADYNQVNVELTKKIIQLCKRAKIRKIVYISGLGVTNSTTFGYFISKLKAEQQIINSGLDYTIFRASYIIGKNDPLTKMLNKQIRNGSIIIPGSGKYRFQPISVTDVSKIIHATITEKKFSNKIIDLVGPQVTTFEEFVRKFAKGKKIVIKKIALEKVYLDALHNPKEALYGIDDLNILVGDFISNNKTLRKLCGFELQRL